MDTLNISGFELMNYLPYCVIEEALEHSVADLACFARGIYRKESRIKEYIRENSICEVKVPNVLNFIELEKEVTKEVDKILHTKRNFQKKNFGPNKSLKGVVYRKKVINVENKENVDPSL